MTVKKYLVIPNYTISLTDADRHYVDAHSLIQLYGVNPKECIVIGRAQVRITKTLKDGSKETYIKDEHNLCGIDVSKYIILRPRRDGNYTLPEVTGYAE